MENDELRHIFLAEDNSADVYLVREAIRRTGLVYELHLASDGEEALSFLQRFGADLPCPHVMILDLNLPRNDGADLLKRWREHPHCGQARIIVMTSSDAPADRAMAAEHGAIFFRKPLDMDEFFRIGTLAKQLCDSQAAHRRSALPD